MWCVLLEPGAVIWHQLPVLPSSPTLMRLISHCESHCAGPFRFIPCLPAQSKDASRDAASPPAATVAEEEPPPVQKIEVLIAAGKDDDDAEKKREDGEKAPAAAPGKSCLKKTSCGGDDECADKGNVKWLDLLGKDLTEIKEYEPSECGDLLDDGDGISTCVCVIQ